MYFKLLFCVFCVYSVSGYPQNFETEKFKVGIEYENSLPMSGGSDRYRHRNNYDPFYVTVNAKVKSGYVLSYLEVSATFSSEGEIDFEMIRGEPGAKSLVFRLVSNHSDFLSYSYLVYGLREEEYKKYVKSLIDGSIDYLTQENEYIF